MKEIIRYDALTPLKKMEVLHNGLTDVFLIGSDILCIYRSNGKNGENVVSLSNFSGESRNIDLETIFSQNLLSILLSTTQDHVILGEYLARDFIMYPYEGVTLTFISD